MNEKYQQILKQNKLWAIAGLILPTVSTIFLLFLIFFEFTTYLEITALIISISFVFIASYWWWWTMYQIYQFTKNVESAEKNIETLGKEFQYIKEDIKKL